jgi:exosortase/archaeosortase family protein
LVIVAAELFGSMAVEVEWEQIMMIMKSLIYLLAGSAAAVLAAQPVCWLIGTWSRPGYQDYPVLVFVAAVALFLWSVTSARDKLNADRSRRLAIGLLLGTFLIRLGSQVLAINVIGAFALAIDVYALGLLAGLAERRRRLSPGWLAVLFLFCLPVEPIFQRSVGYLLQQASAAGACQLLGAFFAPLDCAGTRIVLMGREVLVDVPCSGARLLTTLLMLLSVLGALVAPRARNAAIGIAVTLFSAWAANTVRISALAVGIVFQELSGVDVMSALWHELIGLMSLGLGAAPLLIWAHEVSSQGYQEAQESPETAKERRRIVEPSPADHDSGTSGPGWKLGCAGAALGAAVLLVQIAPQPVDVSAPVSAPTPPASLSGYRATNGALSDQERRYFTRYGGTAQRAFYGPFALLLVRTTSPLRHLHAPESCLEGAGHRVRYLTARFSQVPTAFYRSEDVDGEAFEVRVSYVSASGRVATSVSEVVWHWLKQPREAWTMVQRIAPASISRIELERWDAAVARAYNLNSQPLSNNIRSQT